MKNHFTKERIFNLFYFLLPLFLWDLQFGFTRQSLHQIRTEEISESIRNVFWLQEGTIYDGISSNVGYYGILLAVYKIFGFGIHTAKYVRLILHLISLFCLWLFLKRSLGIARAWLPLLVMGLSPTWLYFNSLQTSFGMDLQFAPVCLLLYSVNNYRGLKSYILTGLLGFSTMAACMTYPTFLLYLPSLGLLVLVSAVRETKGKQGVFLHGMTGFVGFLVPLIATLLFVRDPALLIYDPNTNSGIFRGGGRIIVDFFAWGMNVLTIIEDLFYHGTSYYFEIQAAEFSGLPLQILTVTLTFYGVALLFRNRGLRLYLFCAYLLIIINLVVPNLTDTGFPGLRRATGLVAGIYGLFSILLFRWKWEFLNRSGRVVLIFIAGLFLFHHARAYQENYRALGQASKFREDEWFVIRSDPEENLQFWLKYQADGGVFQCSGPNEKPRPCFYSRIYGALAGYRRWNGIEEIPVRAMDWKTGRIIQLNTSLWESYYFPH